jgi:uncharacterized protein (DUF486 family)
MSVLYTVILLVLSNIFMTFAWYGHLKFTHKSIWVVILVSWGIAFFEYCIQVPANRIGYKVLDPIHLKVIQEIITFCVFIVFSYFYLGQKISITQIFGVCIICLGAYFVFRV